MAERRNLIHSHAIGSREGPVVIRGSGPRRPGLPRGAGTLFIVLVLVVGAYWALASFRQAIADAVPDLYPLLKTAGLDVEEPAGYSVRAVDGSLQIVRGQDEQNQPILRVRGVLSNRSAERKPVPRLIVSIVSSNARTLSWTYDPPERTLGPDQRMPFETRYLTRMSLRDAQVRVMYEKR